MNKRVILPVLLAVLAALPVSGQVVGGWRQLGALRGARGEAVLVRSIRATTNEVALRYGVPDLQGAKTGRQLNGANEERVLLGNAPRIGEPGRPVLPVIPARVLIPAGYAVDHVEVAGDDKVRLPGTHAVEYGETPFPILPGVRPQRTAPDLAIYRSSSPYPGTLFDVIGVQKRRGAAVLLVNLHPVEYLPASGELWWYRNLSLRVTLKPDAQPSPAAYRPDPVRPVAATVDNPDEAATYTGSAVHKAALPGRLGLCSPTTNYAYVIITSEEMKNATGPYALTNLLAHKQGRGLTATIVTTTNIYLNYTGVDNAEKVRNFIIDAYNNWQTDYILLAGDINVVPMRKLRCTASGEVDDIPSDVYFQCLDGPYDDNGNGLWGEPTDGAAGGDVDLSAEVYIGRASAETTNEMENFVCKTLRYENESETAPYLHAALMCGEHLGFGGESEYAWKSMEEIRCGSTTNGYTTVGFTNSPLFTVDTLYDNETNTWAKEDLLGLFNSGRYSILNHLGHANYNYVMKFYNADADALTNDHCLFAYSQGCIPGNFEADCVAEHLTTSTRFGMYAVVFNARYGWGTYNSTDGPSQRFDRQFWDAYFGEKLIALGALNADSHEDNLYDINGTCIRWCFYESNLLGDPQTPMRGQFIADAILLTPVGDFTASGAEGGPFSPASRTYFLFSTATNGGALNWTASCTSSWVALSATNGTLGDNEHAAMTLTINSNAAALPEGDYEDTFVFLNTTSGKGSTTQAIHLVVNNPPRVSNVSVQQGDRMEAGDVTFTIEFDQAMKTTTMDRTDFDLAGAISGHHAPAAWSYSAGSRELTLEYAALPDDTYTLTLLSGDGRLEDADGFDLDGETPSWPIPPNASGDGVEGGNFSVSFTADAETVPYGGPLTPKTPLGSLVYDPDVSANLAPAGDEDRFTITLEAGLAVTVTVEPGSSLQPVVRLLDPSGTCIGGATSTAAGVDAIVQTAAASVPGLYTVAVSGAGASTGMYTAQVVLNAAQELEEHGGPTNDTMAMAQNLDAGFVTVSGGVSRAAVLGYAARGPQQNLLSEGFEAGLNGFVASNSYGAGGGLWHLSTGRQADGGHTATHSVYYGHNEGAGGGGDYDTDVHNSGALYSPRVNLPDSEDLVFDFGFFLETEGSRTWDLCTVDIDSGAGYTRLLASADGTLPTGTGGQWTNATVSLAAYRGTGVVLRFTFDTIDNVLNDYEGWYVDDVRITTYDEGQPDYYSFALPAGGSATLVLGSLDGGTLSLALCDSNGTVLAAGAAGAKNVSSSVCHFTAPSAGAYFARVKGKGALYNLVVLRDGEFELEPNHPIGGAQVLSNGLPILGSLAAAPISAEVEPNDDGVDATVTNDMRYANDWSGSFFPSAPDTYVASLSGVISTGRYIDADLFKFCAGPGDSVSGSVAGLSLSSGDFALYNRTGTRLVYSTSSDASLRWTNFAYAGDYYLRIVSSSSTTGSYTLAATLVTTNFRYGAEDDYFAYAAKAGDLLTVRTWTPGDAPGEFVNGLDPLVELYSPEGELVATNDNGGGDGRNVLLNSRALMDGTYAVRLRAVSNACGEYVLQAGSVGGPPLVTFDAASAYAFETGGVFVLPVRLTAATSDTVTVNFGVAGGTAVGGGTDYALASGTLTFTPGMTETSIAISIVNDSASEGTETILVALSNAVHAATGHYPTNKVVIVDDENPLVVQFSASSFGVQETATSALVTVTRAGGNSGRITVDYAATNGIATPGIDFVAVTGRVTLADGSSSASFRVPVMFDMTDESDETVNLALRNPCYGVALGGQSNATLTIYDYKYPRTNMLQNGGFETPTTTNIFSDGWWSYGLVTREDWAARSGSRGGNFQGWVEWEYGYISQDVNVSRGTYTFSLWMRRETGFAPWSGALSIAWYDSDWNTIQPSTTLGLEDLIPADGAWHPVYVTGTCMDPALAHVSVGVDVYWGTPPSSPSGFMFDDAAFYGGAYTGVSALANGGFEQGLSSGDKWRGSSWYATPENICNTRETWAGHSGSWGGALYGWVNTSNTYTTRIEQNLVPGTGTYTFALWLKREQNFLLTNAQLRIGWYDATYTGKIQPDAVTNLAVPRDNAWHEYFLTGTCTNPSVFEARPCLFAQYLYNTTNVDLRAMELDDARFVRGIPDSDGDGMTDPWENAYFGGATSGVSTADADGDGFSNGQEFMADSNPNDIDSCLRIVAITDACTRCVSFLCSPLRSYDVEYSTNTAVTGWQILQAAVPGASGCVSVSDTNAVPGFRMYRIRLCPP